MFQRDVFPMYLFLGIGSAINADDDCVNNPNAINRVRESISAEGVPVLVRILENYAR